MSNSADLPEKLKVSGLTKYFPVQQGFLQRTTAYIKAVDGIDFSIKAGQTLGLVGESGCGKSTVARLLLRLHIPDSGSIEFEGENIAELSKNQMRGIRRKIQIVFQDPYGSLNPRMTIGETIEEGLLILGLTAAERKIKVAQLLDLVGLSPYMTGRYPHQFSGGQRQRVGIARALSVNPSLLLLDEPIAALDVSIQAQIINLFSDLQKQIGLSYLFISHDLNVVGHISHMVAVMYLGKIMEYAKTDVIFDNPMHPYTKALISSSPKPNPRYKIIHTLEGDVPSPINPLSGCRFQLRCPLVEPDCCKQDIPMTLVSSGHMVRCCKI